MDRIEGRALRRTVFEMPGVGLAAEVFELAEVPRPRRPPDRVERVRLDLAARLVGLPQDIAETVASGMPGVVRRGGTFWVPPQALAAAAVQAGFYLKKDHVC